MDAMTTLAGTKQAGGEAAAGEGGGTDGKELGHGTGNKTSRVIPPSLLCLHQFGIQTMS